MQDKIILLDTDTTNKIAAGEVVEKPSSVVKELIENSLDAKAKTIQVQIVDGGTKYIRITDDGTGMSQNDAKMSVLRYATSKIKSDKDLFSIQTLGFRGEALASIASVSNFSLITRQESDDLATKITIEGGQEPVVEQMGSAVGTSIIVENLFYNVPARQKFLRTFSTEGRYISDIIAKLALTRPDVKFILVSNDRQTINTPGNGNLADCIAGIYGAKAKEDLLKLDLHKEGVEITGYIGKPSSLKSSRQWQTIIVNGRIISSRFISRAIDHAYQSQLPRGGYPFALIKVQIDMDKIDVNVHPQKSEIRFSDEQAVYKAVYAAVSNSLQRPMEKTSQQPLDVKLHFAQETTTIPDYKPQTIIDRPIFKNEPFISSRAINKADATDFVFAQQVLSNTIEQNVEENEDVIFPLGQIDRTYIVAKSEDTLYLIDQHAAHERIIFDRLTEKNDNVPAQQLLLPTHLQLASDEIDLILNYKDVFNQLCFDLQQSGPNTMQINSLPADVDDSQLEVLIRQTLQFILQMKKPKATDLKQHLIAMTSCKAAIKAGQTLNMREMRELLNQLFKTTHPFTCPHGRPIIITYGAGDLAHMFKRT